MASSSPTRERIAERSANSLLVKLNQMGMVTETLRIFLAASHSYDLDLAFTYEESGPQLNPDPAGPTAT